MKKHIYLLFCLLILSFSTNHIKAQNPDIDGDGILNSIDLDDDNDGILDTQECTVPAAVRMLSWMNSSSTFPPTYDSFTSTDLAANNSTAGSGLTRIWATPNNYQSISNVNATTEAQAITNDEYVEYKVTVGNTPLAITQLGYYRISSSIDNTTYTFSARVSDDNFTTNTVVHGSTTYTPTIIATDFTVNASNGPIYLEANKTYTFRIYFYNPGGGSTANFGHDDFKLFGYKECDYDGDGIPNRTDLDSDNDGCVDAIEGDSNITINQLVNSAGTLTVGLGSSANNQNLCAGTNCIDANGIPTIIGGSGQSLGDSQNVSARYQCIDTDGDQIPDNIDLDDDNDGILDTVENCIDNTTLTLGRNNIAGVSTFSIIGGDNNVTNVTPGYTYWVGQGSQDESIQYTFTNPIYAIQIPQVINITGSSTTDTELLEVYINGTLYPINASMVTGLSANSFISSGGAIGSTTMLGVTNFTAININYPAGITSIRIRNNPNSSGLKNGWEMNGLQLLSRSTCNTDVDGDGISNFLDLDSDNDGCPDAIEGDENVTPIQLVTSGGTLLGGNGVNPTITPTSGFYNQAVLLNLCADNSCVDNNGIPTIVNSGGTADIGGDQGQGIGSSKDTNINACICYKPAATTGTTLDTKHGITALGRAGAENGNWPMIRKGAWTALEAKTKGFVINRIPTTVQVEAIPNPIEGMMVYDEEADCLKINIDGTSTGWKCFNTPACPD